MKTIMLTVCFLLHTFYSFSQSSDNSAGPAPLFNVLQANNPVETDASIGKRYFSQIYTSPNFQLGKAFTESCVITNIGAAIVTPFTGGLLNRNGIIYTWNQTTPFQLWSIDTVTGVSTLIFNITGVPMANLTGMCYDGTDVYGLATSLSASQIFRMNMTTGACTPIGAPQAICAGGITMLCRQGIQYSLFVLDIVGDNLYKFNKSTGTATLVGPLGVNINFGQDGSVDWTDNTFYAMAYSTASELRKVDTATGSLGPVLCTYTGQATGMATIYSGTGGLGYHQLDFCRSGINVPITNNTTTYDSVNIVLGVFSIITDVNVKIVNVTHTWVSDLSFYIRNSTTGVKIINRVGGSGDNFINTILDDSASIPISSGTAPFTGSYRPENPLTPFNGAFNQGYWKIVITDTATGDTGVLTGWCLQITYLPYLGGIQTIEIPNYYSLSQNYPNPFNPNTTINYTIPVSGNVKLVVYDALGREVKTLVNEMKNPGVYNVNFDASSLSSGIYFYRIEAGSFIQTRKMLLIK